MTTHPKGARMVDGPLVDDPQQSADVCSLLRAGIDDEVTSYDFQSGLAKHMAAVAALPPATSAPHVPAAAAAGMSGKALLAWIGVPVASASVIAALWFSNAAEPVKDSGRTALPATPVATQVSIQAAPLAPAAPTQPASSATNTIEPVATPAPVITPRSERHARAQRNASTAVAAVSDKHDAITAVLSDSQAVTATENGSSTEAVAPQPSVEETQAQDTQRAPSAADQEALARKAAEQAEQERVAREEARRVAEERLKREMKQLMQATNALTSNPARALSLAQAGEQEFHSSLFSEERQHVLLLALIKLGRLDEAERRAEPYLRAHPDSPFARRVRNALDAAR